MNPEQLIERALQDPRVKNNARVREVMRLRQNKDTNGMLEMAKNISQNNGTDYETEKNKFMKMFGI